MSVFRSVRLGLCCASCVAIPLLIGPIAVHVLENFCNFVPPIWGAVPFLGLVC